MAPDLGIFLSPDPASGHAVRPATLHRYSYAGADPVNRIDPSGREFNLQSLQGALFTLSYVSTRVASALLPAYLLIQRLYLLTPYGVDRFLTWYDRVNFALDVIDAGSEIATWLQSAKRSVLYNTKPVPVAPGTEKGYGVFWEGVTDVNVGGTVEGIDHWDAESGTAVSQRSHALSYSGASDGIRKYKNVVRADARELVNAVEGGNSDFLKGTDRWGVPRQFRKADVRVRMLIEIVPGSDIDVIGARQFRRAMEELSEELEATVMIFLARNWSKP